MKKCGWGGCGRSARHCVRYKDSSIAFFCDEHYDKMEKMYLQESTNKFTRGSLHGQAH